MTQRDVAQVLNKPPSWIGRIESRERRMDLVEFIAIARALGHKEIELLREIGAALPKRLDV
jgi:transcriptional regulator with XRE-family HTH domain